MGQGSGRGHGQVGAAVGQADLAGPDAALFERMKVVISYPGVAPHTHEVARAFHEAGCLSRYETTFVYDRHSLLGKALRWGLSLAMGNKAQAQLQRRELRDIPSEKIRTRPVREILRTVVIKAGLGSVLADRVWEYATVHFDRSVAGGLAPQDDAVYSYEHCCAATFEKAAALGIRRIFDMASPHYKLTHAILDEELEKYPSLRTSYHRSTATLEPARRERQAREFELADLVVANSRFTAKSLLDTGYDPQRIRVIPLGAPPIDPGWRQTPPTSPTIFLFAGTVGVHKGAHYLLECWDRVYRPGRAVLQMAGSWALPAEVKAGTMAGVRCMGSIPREQLFELYRRASVLVLPSLCDGFGMVIAEALAHGLPVITTTNTGAVDLIEHGRNGWIVAPRDIEGLAQAMTWCMDHPWELRQMREEAQATAARWQWSDYRKKLVREIFDLFHQPMPAAAGYSDLPLTTSA